MKKPALRVGYVTQWFKPEKVTQSLWIADDMRARGLAVRVLTGMPNYPEGIVHEGYGGWRVRREVVDGFDVTRAPLYADHSTSSLKRMANYMSWAVSATWVGQRLLRRADVNLVYSSPATAALPAMVARALFGRPYVLLIQDVWPDSIFATGHLKGRIAPLVEGIMGAFCAATYRGASEIAVISPGMIELLTQRGVPREKLHLVYNWVDEAVFSSRLEPGGAGVPAADGERVLMYAGAHGDAQDLGVVIDGMHAAVAQGVTSVRLVFIGDGVQKPELIKRAAAGAAKHLIEFREPLPAAAVAPIVASAHAQIVSLKRDPLFDITMPSKMQSTLASGIPVLAVMGGDVAQLVAQSEVGWVAQPGDVADVTAAITAFAAASSDELLAKSRESAALYRDRLSQQANGQKLAELLLSAAQSRRGFGRGSGA